MNAEDVAIPEEAAPTPAEAPGIVGGATLGAFKLLGDPQSAPVCIDGVCELPTP